MIYSYLCWCGAVEKIQRPISEGPPAELLCSECGKPMERDWQADAPMIATSSCRDPDHIPEQHRVQRSSTPRSSAAEEAKFQRHIAARRRAAAEGGGGGRSIKQTHCVPADLYHGKIRQTGDRNYWSDPKNLAKHSSCKVTK